MNDLQATIREALDHAPPEHLELALTALIEARFGILRPMPISTEDLQQLLKAYQDSIDAFMRAQNQTRLLSMKSGSMEDFQAFKNAMYEEEKAEHAYVTARLEYSHALDTHWHEKASALMSPS